MSLGLKCWICGYDIGNKRGPDALRKSRDHVIPKKFGGEFIVGNIKWAHKWCNNRRGHNDVTPEFVSNCQSFIKDLSARTRKIRRELS